MGLVEIISLNKVTMKTVLKDTKLGDKISFLDGAEPIVAHVIGHNGTGSTLLGWTDNETRCTGSWSLDYRRKSGEQFIREAPEKYTYGYWFSSSHMVKVFDKTHPVATLGFLGACIVAGAGLSRVSVIASKENKTTLQVTT